MNSSSTNPLAQLPSIDDMLKHPSSESGIIEFGKNALTDALRQEATLFRATIMSDENDLEISREKIADHIVATAIAALHEQHKAKLKPVFNLTGTVLHTNLGRAPMPEEAIQAMSAVARSASNLEFDLDRGKRGDRDQHVETWVCHLTGCEAATVVNNNAAAVLLVLNTFAQRKEVLVSRGELIEIGGSFRIPDVMKRAGAKLCEVGTTNRTHAHDFTSAISAKTALIMKVHASNYHIQGFTAEVPEPELARIAQAASIPFVNDLGSGTLADLSEYGLPHEPTVAETLNAGADLVTFSGDKLLGGPQAGIIAGRADLVKKIKANPMKRALRVDKMTLAALEAVLKIYHDPAKLAQKLPAIRLLTRTQSEIADVAAQVVTPVREFVGEQFEVDITDCKSQIGSGAQPVELLPSKAIAIRPAAKRGRGKILEKLSLRFRSLACPVIGRIEDGCLLLDLRCLENPDDFNSSLKVKPPEGNLA
ncbi:MAG: L-seryl-tRNA(Sec) selenium transferase [Gammaproteobacteria bacterium]